MEPVWTRRRSAEVPYDGVLPILGDERMFPPDKRGLPRVSEI